MGQYQKPYIDFKIKIIIEKKKKQNINASDMLLSQLIKNLKLRGIDFIYFQYLICIVFIKK